MFHSHSSYMPDPYEGQLDAGSSSLHSTLGTHDVKQNNASRIVMPTYSSQPSMSCQNSYEIQDSSRGVHGPCFSSEIRPGEDIPMMDSTSASPYPPVEELPCFLPFVDPYSPTSAKPCPRISRLVSTSASSNTHTPSIFQLLPANDGFKQLSESNRLFSFHSSRSSSSRASSTNSSPYLVGMDPNIQTQSNRLTPSAHSLSQSASPQSVYSDITEERPFRRRRLACSSSPAPSFSEVGGGSDTSPTTVSRKHRKSLKPATNRSVQKSRSKQTRNTTSSNASSAFSTFSVNLSHTTDPEPAGATYMSTVDFREDAEHQVFEHGPTDLPPRPYIGGPDAESPWKPRKNLGTIPGSALDYLPIVEDRMERLEWALTCYLRYRGERAVQNSILPGMESEFRPESDVASRSS